VPKHSSFAGKQLRVPHPPGSGVIILAIKREQGMRLIPRPKIA